MFDADLSLVLGLFLLALSVPAVMAAMAELRRPILGLVLCAAGIGFAVHGYTSRPGGYSFDEAAVAVYAVFDRVFLD